jgi:hypothetical protein
VTSAQKQQRITVRQTQTQTGVDFMPGSLMSRLVNARTQTLDWKKLFEMADAIGDKTHDLSTQPTLGLIRGELKLGGGGDKDDLNNASRASGYREYVLQRTLGMKAMLTAATNGTCKDPKRRCAIGRALAEPKNPRSLFATFAARATPEGVDAFLRGCEEDLRAIEGELTEENVARTKNFYGAHVNEAHFEYLENQARKCAERAASSSAESSSFTVVPVVVPNMDVVENAAADENANNSGDDEDSGGEASMMFGKKSKKKKNKKNGGGGATSATSAAATSNLVSSILAKGKGLTAEDALSIMAEKFGSTEPAFPEIQAWGQTTSSEAAAVVLSILSRAPAGCAVVLPSNLMTSTLTFGVRDPSSMNTTTRTGESPSSSSLDTVGFVANTSGALAFSIDAVARPNWRQTNPSVSSAIWISFDDAADTKDTDADTITKSALSALKSSKIPVTVAAFTLARAALECDAVAGPSDAVALGAAASARAHARISTALGDDEDDDE